MRRSAQFIVALPPPPPTVSLAEADLVDDVLRLVDERQQVQVRDAARLLDEVDPDWFRRVDPDRLLLVSETRCVLGQLYGRYAVGLEVLRRALGDERYASPAVDRARHGFCAHASRDLWLRELATRLERAS